MHDIIKKKKPP